MRRQRATFADRVSQVIEVIELGRRTGLLSVERDSGAALEEGDIYFLNGQAIYASTGAQSGRAALETLRAWGACRFAFLSDIPKPVPNIGPERGMARPAQTGGLRSGPLPAPSGGRQRTSPLPPAVFPSSFAPSSARREPQQGASPYPLPRAPQPPAGIPAFSPPLETTSAAPVLAPYQRPRRAPNPQDIPRLATRYQLSRAQRTLLLLADGEHTIQELARLVGRSEAEALALFTELFRLGLITVLS